MGHGVDDSTTEFLADAPARRGDYLTAVCLSGLLVLACCIVIPFAQVQGPPIPGFIMAYEAALVLGDTITAVLLFGQLHSLRRWSIVVLGCGYFFTSCVVFAHAISFP